MGPRLVIACVIVAAASALAVGAALGRALDSTGPREDPAAFASRVVALIVADDYRAAWATLNSAHQRVAPRDEYVACERMSPVDATLSSIRVVRVLDRSVRVPGASRRVPAKAVTLHIQLVSRALGREAFDHTFDIVAEGSHWTWILTPSRYRLYRTNSCGET